MSLTSPSSGSAPSSSATSRYDLTSLVTVIVTSSPSRRHPSTELLETLFESLKFIDGLYECPRIILLDGYNIKENQEVKRGRVSQKMATAYEEYCLRIVTKFENASCRVMKSATHLGFAFSVKIGLQQVKTPYAFILQHDRVFCRQFGHLPRLLEMMELYTHIRYIGFPCPSSRTHASQIISRYSLSCFISKDQRIPIAETLYLQPLLFWFDSNHLCHVNRYLEIYKPYINIWPELRTLLGPKRVKKLVLRNGDFIEDRFGQMQRIILTSIVPNEVHTSPLTKYADPPINSDSNSSSESPSETIDTAKYVEFLLQSFYWFGSYMVWLSTDELTKPSSDHVNTELTEVFVYHLDGRRRDPATTERKRAAGLVVQHQLAAVSLTSGVESDDESNDVSGNSSDSDYSDEEDEEDEKDEKDEHHSVFK